MPGVYSRALYSLVKDIRFIRLTSEQEVAAFKQQLQGSLNTLITT